MQNSTIFYFFLKPCLMLIIFLVLVGKLWALRDKYSFKNLSRRLNYCLRRVGDWPSFVNVDSKIYRLNNLPWNIPSIIQISQSCDLLITNLPLYASKWCFFLFCYNLLSNWPYQYCSQCHLFTILSKFLAHIVPNKKVFRWVARGKAFSIREQWVVLVVV